MQRDIVDRGIELQLDVFDARVPGLPLEVNRSVPFLAPARPRERLTVQHQWVLMIADTTTAHLPRALATLTEALRSYQELDLVEPFIIPDIQLGQASIEAAIESRLAHVEVHVMTVLPVRGIYRLTAVYISKS